MFGKPHGIPNIFITFAVEIQKYKIMVAAQLIENKIAGIEPAKVFTIDDLGFPPDWWENVRVKLGRMVKSGLLERVGRGKYFKPKKTMFGDIGPNQSEVVKDLMYDDGVLSGYITGYSVWNQMGLTSQISNIIVVGTSRRRDTMTRGHYQIRFIMQPNRISNGTIPLLQILDSLKLIKQIPDSTVPDSIAILKRHISRLDEKRFTTLVRLSKKYPPRVRALLGAILESIGKTDYADTLRNTLNPTTIYSIGLNGSTVIDTTNWNLK